MSIAIKRFRVRVVLDTVVPAPDANTAIGFVFQNLSLSASLGSTGPNITPTVEEETPELLAKEREMQDKQVLDLRQGRKRH